MSDYWTALARQRISRRRGLIAVGGLTASAALLAACGGGEKKLAQGSVYQPIDTTKSAKRGGIWRTRLLSEPRNWDPLAGGGGGDAGTPVQGDLLRMKPGYMANPPLAAEPDIAQAWEFSPDKLTFTLKLNPEAKFGPLSPTFHRGAPSSIAGRVIDTDDVLFGWERFRSLPSSAGKADLVNEVASSAPVLSVTAPDKRTVVFKLIRPYAPLPIALAGHTANRSAPPMIYPKEGRDDKIDFLKMQFGSGPFYIDSFEPSVGVTLKRNPFFEALDPEYKRPFVDQVNLPLVTEAAQRLAQFRAGNIWYLLANGVDVLQSDALAAKKDIPELEITTRDFNSAFGMAFGMHQDSPFRDVRVRQAVSYSWDRDQWIEVFLVTDELEQAGIPVDAKWSSVLGSAVEGSPNGTYAPFWLNPKDKSFGENAKYYQRNLAEAKALLAAAGYPNGLSFDWFTTAVRYDHELLMAQMADAGLKATPKVLSAGEATQMAMLNPPGNWVGAFTQTDGGQPHPVQWFFSQYHKQGARFFGLSPSGRGPSTEGDPFMNEIIDKMAGEFDDTRLVGLVHEFQRYFAKMQYRLRFPGGASNIEIAWPVVRNRRVWLGEYSKRYWTHEWMDETKAPLKKT